ncbi:cohesin domain-containing protein [Halogeometricum sp. S1BR25-6]|uniref:Cohesin domain-containing protein n=1 Tax=Halogeometricum salsisoli TaxID=2950536 RepID=A0ABU2GIX9_9EURY|nr:cohesin domain-containing protein [Halogeometricum sp. S1BR25-6]MDS0300114.1 cohesin domain-containing protein [Halogeometricum sp. S1BR25-6]
MSDRTNVLAVCALLMAIATVSVGAVMVTESTASATTTAISVGEETATSPDDALTAEPGETITVTVWANASAVTGYQTRLGFDPDVVRVDEVAGSDDFAAPVSNVDNESGSVVFNQARPSEMDDPVLVEITLTVVGEAGESTALSFDRSETKFVTDGGQAFTPETYGNVTLSVE